MNHRFFQFLLPKILLSPRPFFNRKPSMPQLSQHTHRPDDKNTLTMEWDLENFFLEETLEDGFFSFDDITWQLALNSQETLVTFHFSSSQRRMITSAMLVKERTALDHISALFSIGMCVLPWYWMKYGCQRVIINSKLCPSTEMMEFWQTLYSNVLLEFLHFNRLANPPKLCLSDTKNSLVPLKRVQRGASKESVLVPIGGKSGSP